MDALKKKIKKLLKNFNFLAGKNFHKFQGDLTLHITIYITIITDSDRNRLYIYVKF